MHQNYSPKTFVKPGSPQKNRVNTRFPLCPRKRLKCPCDKPLLSIANYTINALCCHIGHTIYGIYSYILAALHTIYGVFDKCSLSHFVRWSLYLIYSCFCSFYLLNLQVLFFVLFNVLFVRLFVLFVCPFFCTNNILWVQIFVLLLFIKCYAPSGGLACLAYHQATNLYIPCNMPENVWNSLVMRFNAFIVKLPCQYSKRLRRAFMTLIGYVK